MGRAVLLMLALSGCASVPAGTRPMTVGEVVQRQDELDGQSIRVEAIMGGCNLSGCELRDAGGGSSSILAGGDAAYANAARRAAGRVVIVQGRFDGSCLRGSAVKAPGTGLVACVGTGTPIRGARIVATR